MKTIVIAAGMGLFLAVAGTASATEQPKYTVIDTVDKIEIRRYGVRIAAEATVTGSEEAARNDGFRKVAGFIFGGNTTRKSVAMTAPVVQSAAGKSQPIAMTAPVIQSVDGQGVWRVQFIMPSKYTRETLPVPTDPAVRIVDLPPQDYAVLRFSGWRDGKTMALKTTELKAALSGRDWKATGPALSWFYDPPGPCRSCGGTKLRYR